ncbi:MAG: hypothetical protein ACFFCM_06905, partial [Promethearchaeota archaeon]
MEKKITAILLICIIAGASGLTFGYIYMTRQEGIDQTLLLLAMIPPKTAPIDTEALTVEIISPTNTTYYSALQLLN